MDMSRVQLGSVVMRLVEGGRSQADETEHKQDKKGARRVITSAKAYASSRHVKVVVAD